MPTIDIQRCARCHANVDKAKAAGDVPEHALTKVGRAAFCRPRALMISIVSPQREIRDENDEIRIDWPMPISSPQSVGQMPQGVTRRHKAFSADSAQISMMEPFFQAAEGALSRRHPNARRYR